MKTVPSPSPCGNLSLLALVLAPVWLASCGLDPEVWDLFCSKKDPCPPAVVAGPGGAGGGAASSSSSASVGSGGCVTPADCPGVVGDCTTKTCTGGVCGKDYAAPGTVVDTLAKGDCKSLTCNGQGMSEFTIEPSDFIDDANPCTYDYCESDGTTTHQIMQAHAPCPGGVCTDMAACVECISGVDCPASLNCQAGGTPGAKCLTATCFDGIQNQGEKYADCGGPCPPCP